RVFGGRMSQADAVVVKLPDDERPTKWYNSSPPVGVVPPPPPSDGQEPVRQGAPDQPAVVVQADAEVPARREPQVPPGLALGAQCAVPPRPGVLEPLVPGHVVDD